MPGDNTSDPRTAGDSQSALRVVHVLDHSLPLHSGYSFRSMNILKAQAGRGWHPSVVTSPKHDEELRTVPARTETLGGFEHFRTESIPRDRIPFRYEFRLIEALARRIKEVCSRTQPHLIHAHSPVLNAMAALRAGRKLGIPVVYEIRAFWEDAAVDHGTYGEWSFKYRLVRHLETRACRQARHVFVLCDGLRHDLLDRGIPAQQLSVVRNGVNLADFNRAAPDTALAREWGIAGKRVVAFLGSFYRYEGLDLLVTALARLSATVPDCVLVLVGGGETESALRDQVWRLGLWNRVRMPGRIPHDRIPALYALADVLAYPRYSMRLTDLVTPLKPLEAMAMGRPLVASDVGGHRELIRHGETGLLFAAGSVSELVSSLDRILADNHLADSLSRQGLQYVRKEHSWAKTTAVYDDVYANLTGITSEMKAGESSL